MTATYNLEHSFQDPIRALPWLRPHSLDQKTCGPCTHSFIPLLQSLPMTISDLSCMRQPDCLLTALNVIWKSPTDAACDSCVRRMLHQSLSSASAACLQLATFPINLSTHALLGTFPTGRQGAFQTPVHERNLHCFRAEPPSLDLHHLRCQLQLQHLA
jgi:hypothetical protein